MFGDFVTLITDQVINGLSKYGWMYGGALEIPLVIRTPMGGRRGYGPTHSQTLEKLFLGVPGLRGRGTFRFHRSGWAAAGGDRRSRTGLVRGEQAPISEAAR